MGTLTIIVKAAQNTAPATVVAPTVNANTQATAPTTTQTSTPRTNTNVNTNPTSSSTANFAAEKPCIKRTSRRFFCINPKTVLRNFGKPSSLTYSLPSLPASKSSSRSFLLLRNHR